jgi:glycosyltransferase involved in cell wall biosynthesis
VTGPINGWICVDGCAGMVSVIVPTYNRRALLLEALQSVADQSYRPIECIVVDDGSTDGTAEAVKKWLAGGSTGGIEFRYLFQANSGAPAARNTGTRESKGEFIQYLDSDDLLYPDKLTQQVRHLQVDPSLDGIFGDWDMGLPGRLEFVRAQIDDDLVTQFLGRRCIHTLSFLFRRSIVQRVGPWEVSLRRNQEIDFHLRGVLSGGQFAYRPGNCGLWRLHPAERIGSRARTRDLYTFYRKWVQVLEESQQLSRPRRKAISDALFHAATSVDADDSAVLPEMLSLAWRLNPERPEFRTVRMSLIRSVLGKNLALHAWLWRARRRRNGGMPSGR